MLNSIRLICLRDQFPQKVINRLFSYKSDISTEILYPNRKQNIFTPSPPPPVSLPTSIMAKERPKNNLFILMSQRADNKFNGFIPMNDVIVTYSRSSGPGGQNVNKLDTKVDLRFHVNSAKWIPEAVRERMLVKVGRKMSASF